MNAIIAVSQTHRGICDMRYNYYGRNFYLGLNFGSVYEGYADFILRIGSYVVDH